MAKDAEWISPWLLPAKDALHASRTKGPARSERQLTRARRPPGELLRRRRAGDPGAVASTLPVAPAIPGSGGGALGRPGSTGGPLGLVSRRPVGMGFHPDLPDRRDLTMAAGGELPRRVSETLETIREQYEELRGRNGKRSLPKLEWFLTSKRDTPGAVDLRGTGLLPPVEDQGEIGSCTAQVVISMIEYLMCAGGQLHEDMSRMFVYKVTRRLLGWTGDTGAYIRTAIKSVALFGAPPEHEWPYDGALLDVEPDAYLYSFAANFRALAYARHDAYGKGGERTLESVKRTLADGFPVAFGFPVHASINEIAEDFVVPVPHSQRRDRLLGGHAILAVGYDDQVDTSRATGEASSRGALLIRNSWGVEWGNGGYGYLPYEYVTLQLATDFWSIFNPDWVALDQFE